MPLPVFNIYASLPLELKFNRTKLHAHCTPVHQLYTTRADKFGIIILLCD